ncbi:MAG TPA: hypothetical protein VF169_17570 [Albitalea sp.]|uniref:hypothetical protein n=1 Tax=Piscinibacter sp. TaxID=1903157 RepID=UPI002ED417BE
MAREPTFITRRRFLAAALLLGTGPARASELFVIGNGIPGMSAEEVKEVFLGEVQFAGSLRLLPIDNAVVQADFLGRVLKMTPARYAATWTKKAFRDGLNAPPLKATDAEVIGFVKANPGAIGYVGAAPPGIQVLLKV